MKKGNYVRLRKDVTVQDMLAKSTSIYKMTGVMWDYLTYMGQTREKYYISDINEDVATLEVAPDKRIFVRTYLLEVVK